MRKKLTFRIVRKIGPKRIFQYFEDQRRFPEKRLERMTDDDMVS